MAAFSAPDMPRDDGDGRSSAIGDRLPEEILAPIVAGAYARGIAETFERLALPAVFLDHNGRVLFASPLARPFLRGPLWIVTQHLVADRGRDNTALSNLIAGTLSGARSPGSIALRAPPLTLHGVAMPIPTGAPSQLLRAAIIIDDGRDGGVAALVRRLGSGCG